MRFSPSSLLVIQGGIWLGIGVFLLCKGIFLITLLLSFPQQGSGAFALGSQLAGGNMSIIVILIGIGLFLGWVKARFVLIKVIRKSILRFTQMGAPIPLRKIYEGRYYLMLALMIFFGIALRHLGLNQDLRGLICVVIGSALLNGAFLIFRHALAFRVKNLL